MGRYNYGDAGDGMRLACDNMSNKRRVVVIVVYTKRGLRALVVSIVLAVIVSRSHTGGVIRG